MYNLFTWKIREEKKLKFYVFKVNSLKWYRKPKLLPLLRIQIIRTICDQGSKNSLVLACFTGTGTSDTHPSSGWLTSSIAGIQGHEKDLCEAVQFHAYTLSTSTNTHPDHKMTGQLPPRLSEKKYSKVLQVGLLNIISKQHD